MERGEFVGEPFAGGNGYPNADGSIARSANQIPHETGIGNWTREHFITRFKMYTNTSYVPHVVQPGQFQTFMSWQCMPVWKRKTLVQFTSTLEQYSQWITMWSCSRLQDENQIEFAKKLSPVLCMSLMLYFLKTKYQ